MTFANGYTIEPQATPNRVDRDGREGVDAEGKIKGPSGAARMRCCWSRPPLAAPTSGR